MKLEAALRECTLTLLRKIAVHHGLAVGDELLRGELAQMLLQRLLQPEHLPSYLNTISDDERRLLCAVRDDGWTAKAFVLDRMPLPGGPGGRASGRSEPGPILSLIQKGLLFRGFSTLDRWRGEVYYVPVDLQPTLSAALPASTVEETHDLRATTVPEIFAERDVAFDVFCLLSYLRNEPRRMVRGFLPRVELAKLEQEGGEVSVDLVAGHWEERWRFLIHLCLAGGWIKREGAILRPARGAERVLQGSPSEVRARLLDRYVRDRGWSDLAAAGRVRPLLGGRPLDEAAARRLLVHYLEELAGGYWIDEERFVQAIRSRNPDFLREDYSSLSWAVVDAATDVQWHGPSSWDPVEGGWLRYLLRGPLHWMGVVRWGTSRGGQPVGFQLRSAGAGGERREAKPMVVRVTPATTSAIPGRLELEAFRESDLALLYRLESYLEPVRRGEARIYRLTRASVLAGVEQGGSWGDLRELLERGSRKALPPSVRDLLGGWAAEYGRFSLEPGPVLTVAGEEEVELLQQLSPVSACLQARLGSRSYLVKPERGRELARRLREAGHPPRLAPAIRLDGARWSQSELSILREGLLALKVLRALQGGMEFSDGEDAARRLEEVLGAEEVAEISLRAQAAVEQLRSALNGPAGGGSAPAG